MKIQAIFCRNSLKNIIYLLIDEHKKEAVCIDPFDAQLVKQELKKQSLRLNYIINTHEHWDHIRGNKELKQEYNCEIYSVEGVKEKDFILKDKQIFHFAGSEFSAHYTPGHTMNHFCLLANTNKESHLFSGDMLFNAGVGNCKNGGDVNKTIKSIEEI